MITRGVGHQFLDGGDGDEHSTAQTYRDKNSSSDQFVGVGARDAEDPRRFVDTDEKSWKLIMVTHGFSRWAKDPFDPVVTISDFSVSLDS